MADTPRERTELLQGTLDMLILRTLVLGPAHGHEIAKHIQRISDDVLRLEHGSLYLRSIASNGKGGWPRSGMRIPSGIGSASTTG